ncbi:MAG TPA: protoporphyrinogen oxidase [Mycobacterium sp.]|nr:protoporphyrinogen oxidase [Mycobacterium sp.]
MSRCYAVVGGGISGLSAAYRLRVMAGDDAAIALFDPAAELGGTLRTIRLAGQPMDVGAEAFVARRPEVPALLAELGLSGAQIGTTGARPLIYAKHRLHPLPADTVNGIPTRADSLTGLLDEAAVAYVAAEPSRSLIWTPGADPAVGDLVAVRFGVDVVARSVDPLLAGVYAGSAATIGLRSAAPAVAAALDRGARSLTDAAYEALPPPTSAPLFGAVRGGYRVLVERLLARSGAEWVPTAITVLHCESGGWRLGDAAGNRWQADAVVLAVPAPRLSALLGQCAPAAAAAAAAIPVASSVVVALAVPADTPLPEHSGVLVATGEPLRAKAITLSSRKWGGGWGPQLLRCSFGRFGDEVARTAGDAQLLTWASQDLSAVFGATVAPIEAYVQRWIDAMPQYGPGHGRLVGHLPRGTIGEWLAWITTPSTPPCAT